MNKVAAGKNSGDSSQKGFFFSLRSKMLIYFGLLFAIILITVELAYMYGIPFTPFVGEYQQQQSDVFKNLNLVADLKKERMLRWVEERRDDARVLSGSSILAFQVAGLRTIIQENIARGKKADELWTQVQKEKVYQDLIQHLNLVKTAYSVYEAIMVADAETGMIIATTRNRDVGVDISQQNVFISALNPINSEVIEISKDPLHNKVDLIISRPIKFADRVDDREDLLAVLMLQINSDDVIKPMLHTGEGLGQTGEVLLVNQDARLLTSLKNPLPDGTTAELLEYRIKAKPAVLAARGREGIVTAEDYRGEPVLAAFRHMRITSELGWGMVVKRDQAEVFAPFRKNLFFFNFIGLAGVLMILVLTSVIANNLSRPIRILRRTVQQVEAGDLNARSPITASDEMGFLANSFNSMIQRIRRWHEELDEQIRNRTVELNSKNEELIKEVAERKRAEAHLQLFRDLINQSNDAIFVIEPDTSRLLDVNEKGCNSLGYTREELLNLGVVDVDASMPDLISWKKHVEEVRKKGYMILPGRSRRKDGTTFPVEVNVKYVSQEEKVYMVAVVRDITERKELEAQLLQAQKMEAIGRFAGSIAHDFNNLLTAIIGNAELLLLDRKPEDFDYENIKTIQETADRAAQLTRQLLAISRKQVLEPVVLDLNEIIQGICKMCTRLVGEDVEQYVILEPNLNRVRADPSQIEQVILNLVINARDAMPEGGKLSISTENQFLDESYCQLHAGVTPGEYVLLSFSDTGVGMPEGVIEHIFEPFYTTKTDGTGLGLSTVYGIVKQLGGHMFAYSEVGLGTTFKIYLPALKAETEDLQSSIPLSKQAMPRGEETILIVEDEAAILKLAFKVLKDLGYTVLSAVSGEEAELKLQQHHGRIDLVLTDVVLPGRSGPEVSEKLKKEYPELKVLFMSGYADDRITHKEILQKGAHFLPKPFTPSVMAGKVREVLDGSQ